VTYATLMVNLQLGQSNAGLLQAAADVADRFDAEIVGIAACQPALMIYDDGCYGAGNLIQQDRDEIDRRIAAAEAEFHEALGSRRRAAEWRSTVTLGSLSDVVSCEARCADLVITGVPVAGSMGASRGVNAGDLVMQLGRPALVVPAAVDRLSMERIVVGWKDAREPRRAVLDALPLLKRAGHVAVVEIARESELADARMHVGDVVKWLARHGVAADGIATAASGGDADGLFAIAREHDAGLIVAGAYGHARLREWAFGGVTRDLLFDARLCSLLSH